MRAPLATGRIQGSLQVVGYVVQGGSTPRFAKPSVALAESRDSGEGDKTPHCEVAGRPETNPSQAGLKLDR